AIFGIKRICDSSHINACVSFDELDQLTSVHVNSLDELFLVSGYSKHVALYDINTGKRLQVFIDIHREHINVLKFANHSPYIFATSSFDHDLKLWDLRQKPVHPCYTMSSGRGNVMVCFSPDDLYLLASVVENEVKQLLAIDGRLHLDFGIAPTRSSLNYTRSYYMNGKDYILSGSCDEHVARICCAQIGRRLRDISLEGKSSRSSMFV
ncbi:WD40 repeat-containing protein, partial [Tanacetum coccineum]